MNSFLLYKFCRRSLLQNGCINAQVLSSVDTLIQVIEIGSQVLIIGSTYDSIVLVGDWIEPPNIGCLA